MSRKHSIASKKRWAKIGKKERSERMANLARHKWASLDVKQRREHAMLMVRARQGRRSAL